MGGNQTGARTEAVVVSRFAHTPSREGAGLQGRKCFCWWTSMKSGSMSEARSTWHKLAGHGRQDVQASRSEVFWRSQLARLCVCIA